MSLLIKALDKAQEEAQTAKIKQAKADQIEAEKALQSKSAIVDIDAGVSENSIDKSIKRRPIDLEPVTNVTDTNAPKTAVNAASEKVAAATALELELSPNHQSGPEIINAEFNTNGDNSVEIKAAKPVGTDIRKPQNYSASNFDSLSFNSTSKASASSLNAAKANAPKTSTAKANANAANTTTTGATKIDAANVFAAKRIEANHQNSKLALIAGVGLLALVAMGTYLYQFIDTTPDVVIARRPAKLPAALSQAQPAPNAQPVEAITDNATAPTKALSEAQASSQQVVAAQNLPEFSEKPADKLIKNQSAIDALRLTQNEVTNQYKNAEKNIDKNENINEDTFNIVDIEKSTIKKLTKSKQNESNPVEIVSKSASIQVSKASTQASINPVLMSAYDAYNAGKDAEAIKLYKQVLQRDVRNVDALLGLGAIAQRQGRVLDANGWYGKVLEVDPKNSFALTAILESQPQNSAINNESRIKSMLAKQPDDANLHATLGNFYADVNQWSLAQQAYFDAYRLNASADNAFNLAVSLDQLGKPKLALPYYQRALLLVQSTSANFDKAALEARISAIQ